MLCPAVCIGDCLRLSLSVWGRNEPKKHHKRYRRNGVTHTHTHARTHARTHTHARTNTHTHTHTHTHARTCTHEHTHTHTHTHTHSLSLFLSLTHTHTHTHTTGVGKGGGGGSLEFPSSLFGDFPSLTAGFVRRFASLHDLHTPLGKIQDTAFGL